MKKLISVLLICSMILVATVPAFATDAESYDLSKLFVDYDEKSLSEMVKYINENQQVYCFIEFFRNHGLKADNPWATPEIQIYMSGNYKSTEVWNAFYSKLSDEHSKYIELNGSRPKKPDESVPHGTFMLGEKGTMRFWIDFTDEFFSHIKTLDRLDGNILIMDFLMNLLSGDVVGISFCWNEVYWDSEEGITFDDNIFEGDYSSFTPAITGDCNGDGAVNSMDSFMMKKTIAGHEHRMDPFAVDMDGDGQINAKDSLTLKRKIVLG